MSTFDVRALAHEALDQLGPSSKCEGCSTQEDNVTVALERAYAAGLAARAAVPAAGSTTSKYTLRSLAEDLRDERRCQCEGDGAGTKDCPCAGDDCWRCAAVMALANDSAAVPRDAGTPEVPPRPVAVCLRCKLLRQPHVSGLACDPAPPVTGGPEK